ncbi:spermatogenesis-associated protein 5-like protein 1 isoform X1 [Hemiscyllium ocellatum]|uniref:spermatogenesis-associated protein 5-like protein 1 isoform X1 n=1 Tax=Hemiscyllium ocellatum TaxID=170820 RepID=UPI002967472D|nr:spermatogenesis-associated protein 5-like protein 1 isoform X1 [Hemiscyllium ocellatum]
MAFPWDRHGTETEAPGSGGRPGLRGPGRGGAGRPRVQGRAVASRRVSGAMVALLLLPPEAGDRASQRCRLGPRALAALGLGLGSPLRVCLPGGSALCSAWPRRDQAEGFLQLDTTCVSPGLLERPGPGRGLRLSLGQLEPLSSVKLRRVRVRTVQVPGPWGEVGPAVPADAELLLLKELLRGLFLRPAFVVTAEAAAWPGLFLVEVAAVEPELCPGGAGLMGPGTQLEVAERLNLDQFRARGRGPGLGLGLGLGGLQHSAAPLREMLNLPLRFPQTLRRLGLSCPRGLLLLGPPGVGKTALLRAVAHDLAAPLILASPATLRGSRPGDSEQRLRRLFAQAQARARAKPCILFIDDIESLFPRRAAAGSRPEDRLVAQLLTLMDGLTPRSRLVVVAASNCPEALDPALRRPGRFDREILIGVPTMSQRQSILKVVTSSMPLRADVDLSWLAEATSGYVGADLTALCREAALQLVRRSSQDTANKEITFADFCEAIKIVQPSCLRSSIGLTDFKPVHWNQIGGLDQVKLKLKQSIQWPVLYPQAFERMGVTPTRGILLCGPPGCAKTTLVKAAASSYRCSFLSISGADLFSPFVGDSEKILAQVFKQARAAAPSILFLDEIDSIFGSRSFDGANGRSVKERVLSVLLNEMDGIGQPLIGRRISERNMLASEANQVEPTKKFQEVCNKNVIVVAATNRPDLLDDALLRPGRFDQIILVPSPDEKTRLSILRICTSKTPLDDVSLEGLAAETAGFTGADIQNLCKEAALLALQENGLDAAAVKHEHFLKCLQSLKPSLSGQQLHFYHHLFSTVTQEIT